MEFRIRFEHGDVLRMRFDVQEYRPGDYIVHLAGKLYAAGMKGCLALTRQFDALSILDSLPHIDSFFNDKHLLTLPGNQFKVSPSEAVDKLFTFALWMKLLVR